MPALRRRQFITLLGGAAVWPFAARAQQPERMRRIGVLMNLAAADPEGQAWTDSRNVRIETRWSAGDPERARAYVAELVALAPDVILADGGTTVGPLLNATRTVPVVFVNVTDPVGGGFVESLARPAGNATGFTLFEYSISVKVLELVNEVWPRVRRVAVLRNLAVASGGGQLGAIQTAAPSFGVELRPVDVREASEIERGVVAFARSSNAGLIVTANTLADLHRELIISLAARHRLPAVYPFRYYVTSGGLVSYGPGLVDPYPRAATHVDRILKGEQTADLPVQAPTKYELVVNLKTGKALGLDIPATVLARADEVIE